MGFNIGDRVVCAVDYPGLSVGEEGTYLGYGRLNSPTDAAVKWDKFDSRRHNCKGKCKSGHGWYVPASHITNAELIDLGELPECDEESSSILFGL